MSRAQTTLSVVLTAGFILITLSFFFIPEKIPERLDKPFMMVIGAWVVQMTTLVNYHFGSSQGSADKNKLLMNLNSTND
jgi:CBS domain containing-hemolysin-like protein